MSAVLGLQGAGVWALLQQRMPPPLEPRVLPLTVEWVVPRPPQAAEAAPPRPSVPQPVRHAPRQVAAPAAMPEPAVEELPATLPPAPPTPPTPAVVEAPVTPATPAAVAASSPLPARVESPRQLDVAAVRYLAQPVLRYPSASRRQGEAGTVQVRVLVGTDGLPKQLAMQRSSGFTRLDEAALAAVRDTRFKPYAENGVPREFWVVMPLVFDLEN